MSISGGPISSFPISSAKRLKAIVFDAASNGGYTAASNTDTWSHTNAGNYLVVGVAMLAVANVSSVTYNGDALTLLGSRTSAGTLLRVELWGMVAPDIGTFDIVVTLDAAVAWAGVATSWHNVHQTSPTEGFNSATATNVGAADATVDVTTVADKDMVVDVLATSDGAVTVGASQTQRANVTGVAGSGCMSNEGVKSPAGAVTMSWTDVGAAQTWVIGGIALRPLEAATLGTTESPSPVTSVGSVVTPSTTLAASVSPVTSAGSVAGQTVALVHSLSPVATASSVTATAESFSNAPSPVVGAPSVAAPSTLLATPEQSAVTAASLVPSESTTISQAASSATAASSVVSVATTGSTSPDPASGTGSVTSPATLLLLSVDSTSALGSVPAVSVSTGGISETANPVVAVTSVASPTLDVSAPPIPTPAPQPSSGGGVIGGTIRRHPSGYIQGTLRGPFKDLSDQWRKDQERQPKKPERKKQKEKPQPKPVTESTITVPDLSIALVSEESLIVSALFTSEPTEHFLLAADAAFELNSLKTRISLSSKIAIARQNAYRLSLVLALDALD